MKKIILIAICVLAAGSVSAQRYFNGDRADYNSYYQPKVGFEVGADIVNSMNNNSASYNTGSLAGFHAGFTYELPIFEAVSFAPELLYSQKGYTANTPSGDLSQRSQFIDMPLLAKFHVGHGLNLYLGPQISYLIASSNNYSNGFATSARGDYSYDGSKTLYDGVIGVGINVTNSVDLHARYAIDLQGTNTLSNYIPAYRNEALQIGLGFKFN